MKLLKPIAMVAGLSALYCGLAFLGFAFSGAGHGSAFFGEAVLAPFSVVPGLAWFGIGLWPVLGVLVALRQFSPCRVLAGIGLAFHYVGVAALSIQTEWYYVGKVLQSLPFMVTLFLLGYVGGQVSLWLLITRRPYAA
jgi:hypothetical protein